MLRNKRTNQTRYHPYDKPAKKRKKTGNAYSTQLSSSKSYPGEDSDDDSDEPRVVDDPVQTAQKDAIKKVLSTATLERKSPYHVDRGKSHATNPIAPVEGTQPPYDWSNSLGRSAMDITKNYADTLQDHSDNPKRTWKQTLWSGGKMVAVPLALHFLQKYLDPPTQTSQKRQY